MKISIVNINLSASMNQKCRACTGSGLPLFELGQLGVVSARALWRDALQVDVGVGEAHGQVVGVAGVDRQVDSRNTNRHCRRCGLQNQPIKTIVSVMHAWHRTIKDSSYILSASTSIMYLGCILGLAKGCGNGNGGRDDYSRWLPSTACAFASLIVSWISSYHSDADGSFSSCKQTSNCSLAT